MHIWTNTEACQTVHVAPKNPYLLQVFREFKLELFPGRRFEAPEVHHLEIGKLRKSRVSLVVFDNEIFN